MPASLAVDAQFERALNTFKQRLNPEQLKLFQFSTHDELLDKVRKIEEVQAAKSKAMNLPRIQGALEAFRQFGEYVEVFLNASSFVAFIWGPMKFLLEVSSHAAQVFDTLLNAYAQIGDTLPLISQYRHVFDGHSRFDEVVASIYGDILEFHLQALRVFHLSRWRLVFRSVWKDFDSRFGSILSNIRIHRELLESNATALHFAKSLEHRRIQAEHANFVYNQQRQEAYSALLTWIAPANSGLDHEAICQAWQQQYPNSGAWLLQHVKFSKWRQEAVPVQPLLWLCGIPGAGKTVLASIAIEDCKKDVSAKTLYCYLKHEVQRKSTCVDAMKMILAQLLEPGHKLLSWCRDESLGSGQVSLCSSKTCETLVSTVLACQTKTYVVVDGLDECGVGERRELINVLKKTLDECNSAVPGSVRALIVSQDEPDIRRSVDPSCLIEMGIEDNQSDIKTYVSHWTTKITAKFALNENQRRYILESTCDNSEGMFLFARLVMENLFHQINQYQVLQECDPHTFPRKLEQAYERIIKRITSSQDHSVEEQALAKKILSWMACAMRPLLWTEIQCALAIDLSSQSVRLAELKSQVHIRDLCGSLVTHVSDNRIELVHRTAKEFLIRMGFVEPLKVHQELGTLCLSYLAFPYFDCDAADVDVENAAEAGAFAFQDYSVAHWADHFQMGLRVTSDLTQATTAECIPELGSAICDFVALYRLCTHVCQGPHSPQGGDVMMPKGTVDKDDVMHVLLLLRNQRARGLNALDDVIPSDLGRPFLRNRTIIERDATCSSKVANLHGNYGRLCFKCPKVACFHFHEGFATANLRQNHIDRHENPYRCKFEDCKNYKHGFSKAKDYEKHMRIYHPDFGEGPITFTKFKEVRNVSGSRNVAKYPRNHQCQICRKTFTRNQALKNHIRIHNGERPHTCDMCPAKFARNSELIRHNKIHSGKNKYVCKGIVWYTAEDPINETTWGCNKDYVKLDSFANHLVQDRGAKCIRPLIDNLRIGNAWPDFVPGDKLPDDRGLGLSAFTVMQAMIRDHPDLEPHKDEIMRSLLLPSISSTASSQDIDVEMRETDTWSTGMSSRTLTMSEWSNGG